MSEELEEELDAFPEPIAIIMGRVSTELTKEKESYLIKAFQEIGINPNVVVEQGLLIKQLKARLRAVAGLHEMPALPDGLAETFGVDTLVTLNYRRGYNKGIEVAKQFARKSEV